MILKPTDILKIRNYVQSERFGFTDLNPRRDRYELLDDMTDLLDTINHLMEERMK